MVEVRLKALRPDKSTDGNVAELLILLAMPALKLPLTVNTPPLPERVGPVTRIDVPLFDPKLTGPLIVSVLPLPMMRLFAHARYCV